MCIRIWYFKNLLFAQLSIVILISVNHLKKHILLLGFNRQMEVWRPLCQTAPALGPWMCWIQSCTHLLLLHSRAQFSWKYENWEGCIQWKFISSGPLWKYISWRKRNGSRNFDDKALLWDSLRGQTDEKETREELFKHLKYKTYLSLIHERNGIWTMVWSGVKLQPNMKCIRFDSKNNLFSFLI